MYITQEEITNQELDVDDSTHPLRKLYELLTTDGDLLSDGEVIDMATVYLQAIGADEIE